MFLIILCLTGNICDTEAYVDIEYGLALMADDQLGMSFLFFKLLYASVSVNDFSSSYCFTCATFWWFVEADKIIQVRLNCRCCCYLGEVVQVKIACQERWEVSNLTNVHSLFEPNQLAHNFYGGIAPIYLNGPISLCSTVPLF